MHLGDVSAGTTPKMSLLSPPRNGGRVSTRTFIPHRVHEAIGVFGAVSVATACLLPGSVADGVARGATGPGHHDLDVEHPTGYFTVSLDAEERGGSDRGHALGPAAHRPTADARRGAGARCRLPPGRDLAVIIDCHGHYTTAPAAHTAWREQQVAAWEAGTTPPAYPTISDDEIRETIETSQLPLMDERGIDLTVFSPRASAMAHHLGDQGVSLEWARRCNDLVHRVTQLFPDRFIGVAQLPQSPGVPVEGSVAELRRCVEELGFVGCNLNPDPSGGHWTSPPLTDRSWYPIYEAMVELDVPAMVHVSGSATPFFHATGAYYIAADTTAFMQLIQGDLFGDLPGLRLVIPHGGGAVPYHWGRYRGLADMLGRPPVETSVMGNVFFDTCVYHQAGIDLLLDVIDTPNLLFGSEMVGAVRGIDPTTGHHFDDTRRYVEAAAARGALTPAARSAVLEGNARRVYPRLDAALRRREGGTSTTSSTP